MLDILVQAKTDLPFLLNEPVESWNSLDVDYEPPRVERLWRTYLTKGRNVRLMLHRIHPCAKALMHPHPWPSAVEVVEGSYEMGVAGSVPPSLATLILTAGSSYEMLNPYGHHYVKPLHEPSLSIMITGEPYVPQVFDHSDFGKHRALQPLTDEAKLDLLRAFKRHFAAAAASRVGFT